MKIPRRLLSFLLVSCLVCISFCIDLFPSQAATIQVGEVNATNVNIRKDASTKTDSLGMISNVTVTVNGSKKGIDSGDTHTWYNITYGNITGYIRDDLITVKAITTDDSFETKLKKFPASYQTALRNLHALYPKWNFVADNIGMTLNAAVNLEISRKLIQGTDTKSYLSMGPGAYDWNTGKYVSPESGWYVASREVIRYYMDPRNFLNKTDIFMYMQQGYDASVQTEAGVKAIIKGSFMENTFDKNDKTYGGSYAKLLMQAGKEAGVSPYVLAAKIIQEQGYAGTSPLISGTYSGFKGYYNFFNVQAAGSTKELVYKNGLTYAKNNGWNSIPKAIIGGAKFCANNYISQGQDTYFRMDFNIKNPSQIWHEYAGAVHDALGCGRKVADYYNKNADAGLTFYIPVYDSMSSTVSALPAKSSKRNNYYFNSIKVSGLTPSFSRFTYSYTLTVDANQTVKVTVPSGASYASDASYSLNTGQNKVVLKVKSETGYTTSYTINVKASKTCTLYIDYGQKTTSTKVMLGDVNGDSKISLIDLVSIQRYLLNKATLTGDAFTAADTNGDKKITLIDLVNLQRHLLGKIKLS